MRKPGKPNFPTLKQVKVFKEYEKRCERFEDLNQQYITALLHAALEDTALVSPTFTPIVGKSYTLKEQFCTSDGVQSSSSIEATLPLTRTLLDEGFFHEPILPVGESRQICEVRDTYVPVHSSVGVGDWMFGYEHRDKDYFDYINQSYQQGLYDSRTMILIEGIVKDDQIIQSIRTLYTLEGLVKLKAQFPLTLTGREGCSLFSIEDDNQTQVVLPNSVVE